MRKSTIFIASTLGARPLADQLAGKLEQLMGTELDIIPWLEWFEGRPGQNILSGLLEACSRCDFAAVLLTNHDTRPSQGNCIFEAGMFTGVFGTKGRGVTGESERCFLLSSLPRADIFSDLSGIIILQIDDNKSSRRIATAAKAMTKVIRRLGPVSRPEIACYSEEEVLEREQVGGNGGLKPGSRVVINLIRPSEANDKSVAQRILTNLERNVHYTYLFSAKDLRVIAQLFHAIATADGDTAESRFDHLERQRKTEANLDRMQRQVGIWLLASIGSFEFCIHNADRNAAVCYLRYPEETTKFIQWCVRERAIEIAMGLERSLVTAPAPGEDHVFRRSADFDLFGSEGSKSRLELESELKTLFEPPLHDRVLAVCFGGASH